MIKQFQIILVPKDTTLERGNEGFSLQKQKEKIDLDSIKRIILDNDWKEDKNSEKASYFDKETSFVGKGFELLINNGKRDVLLDFSDNISIRPQLNSSKADKEWCLCFVKLIVVKFNMKIFSVNKLNFIKLEELEELFI